MKPIELALKYMDIVFNNKDPQLLGEILDDQFSFSGPMFHFNSSKEYIKSLIDDPPEHFDFELIHSYEDKTSVCLLYWFRKPGIVIPMAQFFEIGNEKIRKILLLFDSKHFIA
jgi:hypothetical protein